MLPKLPIGQEYFWRVRAYDGELYSDWSSGYFVLNHQEVIEQDPDLEPTRGAFGCSSKNMNGHFLYILALLFLLLLRKYPTPTHKKLF